MLRKLKRPPFKRGPFLLVPDDQREEHSQPVEADYQHSIEKHGMHLSLVEELSEPCLTAGLSYHGRGQSSTPIDR